MASYLRPRRGKKATAVAQLTASAPLKRGEIFFEVPDTGVGTGKGKIKMGDGTTAYSSLPYFMEQPTVDYTNAVVGWTNTTAADSSPYTKNATYVSNIIPSASLKTIFTNLKKLLLNYNSQLTTLNNDLGGISFGIDSSGNYGYKKEGADTVYPFKSSDGNIEFMLTSAAYGYSQSGDICRGDASATVIINGHTKFTVTKPTTSKSNCTINSGQSSYIFIYVDGTKSTAVKFSADKTVEIPENVAKIQFRSVIQGTISAVGGYCSRTTNISLS